MKHGLPLLFLLLFAASPVAWRHLNPSDYSDGRSRSILAQKTRNASAIANMLGEFRTGISDILMVKTERYMHSGVGYDSHIAEVVKNQAKKQHTHDDHGNHDHDEKKPTGFNSKALIASVEDDFRSFLGDLHRQVKPYTPPNEHTPHTDGTQLLPWYRIASLSDPHHIRSYTMGGYWLSRTDAAAATLFLKEGIEKNPQAFSIRVALAQLYFKEVLKKTSDLYNPTFEELPLMHLARDTFQTAATIALKQRPKSDITKIDSWDENAESDTHNACRMAVLLEKHYGSKPQALLLAKKYLQQLGEDAILKRVVEETPTHLFSDLMPKPTPKKHIHNEHCDH